MGRTFSGYADESRMTCSRCKGSGEVLTENGKTLIELVQRHIYTPTHSHSSAWDKIGERGAS